jgi:hypothetical protein
MLLLLLRLVHRYTMLVLVLVLVFWCTGAFVVG